MQATGHAWPFSIGRSDGSGGWTNYDRALSSAEGNAQGGIDVVGGEVWATWVEHGALRRGLFDTKVFAAAVEDDGQRSKAVHELWSGRTIGPGSTQAVAYDGRIAFLYMRPSRDGRALRATVEISRVAVE